MTLVPVLKTRWDSHFKSVFINKVNTSDEDIRHRMSRTKDDVRREFDVKMVEWKTSEMFHHQRTETAKKHYEKCQQRLADAKRVFATMGDVGLIKNFVIIFRNKSFPFNRNVPTTSINRPSLSGETSYRGYTKSTKLSKRRRPRTASAATVRGMSCWQPLRLVHFRYCYEDNMKMTVPTQVLCNCVEI